MSISDVKRRAAMVRWSKHEKIYRNCEMCGEKFTRPPSVFKNGKGKYCGQKCANGKPRSKYKHYKQSGYVYLKNYDHPKRSKQNFIAEHRYVVEQEINRMLKDSEVVHHIDEIKNNNKILNLFLCKNELEHRKIHKINKTFLSMISQARYQQWKYFAKFDVTKNRQDQLQEILKTVHKDIQPWGMVEIFHLWLLGEKVGNLQHYSNSMEQLWLAFVMHEKFNTTWNGKDWEEGDER